MTKRIILARLKKADPQAYIKLCERAGYLEEAFGYYSNSTGGSDLYHAAELAFQLGKYKRTRELLGGALQAAEKAFANAQASTAHAGSWGAAYDYASAQDGLKSMGEKVSQLEGKLNAKGK